MSSKYAIPENPQIQQLGAANTEQISKYNTCSIRQRWAGTKEIETIEQLCYTPRINDKQRHNATNNA